MTAETRKKKVSDFFHTEKEKLVQYVRRLIDDTAEYDSEDILQEVMLNVFSRADITAPIENLSGYIYQSLRNRVIDLLRKRKGFSVLFEDETFEKSDLSLSDILFDHRSDIFKMIEKKEMQRMMFEAIESLSIEEKAVIIATELEERSYGELSKEWDIPIGTLLARKSRALRKIRAIIENEI